MGRYVGLDFGTSMIKAAVTPSAEDEPSLVSLGQNELFVPVAVQAVPDTSKYRVGREAYHNRRRSDFDTATAFRDRLLSPESTLLLGGRSVDGLAVQSALMSAVGKSIQAAVPDVAAVAVTVPDTWSAQRWSLAVALMRAGWSPLLYAREWCAALVSQPALDASEVLMLSLGFGAARATLCVSRNDQWQAVATASSDAVSGLALRRGLIETLCEDVIRATRRDPREDPEADQLLDNAVEAALRPLHHESAVTLHATLFGHDISRQLTADELATAARPFSGRLTAMVENLLSNSRTGPAACPIVAWGEVALLLPVVGWLYRFAPRRHPITVAPLDVVAAGAARLAAWGYETDLPAPAAVRPADGAYFPESGAPGVLQGGATVPVVQSVPTSLAGTASRRRAYLVRLDGADDQGRREICTNRFRMGRNPVSEYVFDSEQDQVVSVAHAVIIRDGADYVLSDLDSTNGTFLGGKRLVKQRQVLSHGDEIRLGENGPRLCFELV